MVLCLDGGGGKENIIRLTDFLWVTNLWRSMAWEHLGRKGKAEKGHGKLHQSSRNAPSSWRGLSGGRKGVVPALSCWSDGRMENGMRCMWVGMQVLGDYKYCIKQGNLLTAGGGAPAFGGYAWYCCWPGCRGLNRLCQLWL
jgi:hypothetical protein